MKKCKWVLTAICLINLTMCCGCSKEKEEEKIASMEYTVCEESELPQNLIDIIKSRREEEFGIAYSEEEYTYLVKGYGKQDTGGYNILVDDVYYTDSNVVLATTLKGPAESDKVLKAATFPYIAVKVEYIQKDAKFE